MDREILFRALAVDTETIIGNEFYYGDLLHYANGDVTIRQQETGAELKVHKETVCQYTGKKDKNGKLIFENDIVEYQRQLPIFNMFSDDETGGEIITVKHRVQYSLHSCEYLLIPIDNSVLMDESLVCSHLMVVVGNI